MIRLSAFADEISADIDEQISVLQSEGISSLDLRSMWGINVLDLTDEQVHTIKETLNKHEIGVAAIASPIGKVAIDGSFREHLQRFLHAIETPAVRVPWRTAHGMRSLTASAQLLDEVRVHRSVGRAGSFRGGSGEAMRRLRSFIRGGLAEYGANRNHPELDGTSRLSPYLHFGHIGPHTVAMAVRGSDAPRAVREAFLEQLIVRRELAIDFVRYNPRYDRIEAGEPWALATLRKHLRDHRAPRYSAARLEAAETHDDLWNAAQLQMVTGGWMHNHMRMYWAKKILEWSDTPAEAYETALRLNDKY